MTSDLRRVLDFIYVHPISFWRTCKAQWVGLLIIKRTRAGWQTKVIWGGLTRPLLVSLTGISIAIISRVAKARTPSWQRNVRKGAIFPQTSNQKQLKWSNTAYVNKWSFAFKIKLCVSQVNDTKFYKKMIKKGQPVTIPHFKSLLTQKQARWPHFLSHFFNVHIMNVNYAKFRKKFDGRTFSRELP